MNRVSSLPFKTVWLMAFPLILSNMSVPLLGMVDTAVVGHLDSAHFLGAVALGALLFSFIFWGFGFLRMGTTGQIAVAFGQQDIRQVRVGLRVGLVLALVIGLGLLLFQVPIALLGFALIDGSAQVEHWGRVYFDVRIWSAPATLMNYVFIGWFIGVLRTRYPLYVLLLSNSVNIILDLWFVWGLDLGVAGVAWASVIADYVGVVLSLLLVRHFLSEFPGEQGLGRWFSLAILKRFLLVNAHLFIRTLCVVFSFAFFANQGAKNGDVILAANAVLLNFQTFMAYALDGFAHAAEGLVGQAFGQKNRVRYIQVVKACFWFGGAFSLVFAIIYVLFGGMIVTLLTGLDDVRQVASEYLVWVAILPILSVWSYLFDGVFIGANRSLEMRNTMLLSTIGFVLVWWLTTSLGNHGLWLALSAFMVLRALSMGWVWLMNEQLWLKEA